MKEHSKEPERKRLKRVPDVKEPEKKEPDEKELQRETFEIEFDGILRYISKEKQKTWEKRDLDRCVGAITKDEYETLNKLDCRRELEYLDWKMRKMDK